MRKLKVGAGIAGAVGLVFIGGGALTADAASTATTAATACPPGAICYPLLKNSVTGYQIVDGSTTGVDVKDGTLTGADAADGSFTGVDVKDGSINSNDLSTSLYNLLYAVPNNSVTTGKMADGAATESKLGADVQTKLNDQRQKLYADAIDAPVVVAKVGGPIATNGTKLDDVDLVLPAGTYIVQVSGQIDRTTAVADPGKQTQPQLSLWFDNNNDGTFEWQTGEGSISPNGLIPDTKGRSVTVNGQTLVTLDAATHVKLLAFGYNADTSSAGGGELTVSSAMVSAIPVK
jgi:hypothetical protein